MPVARLSVPAAVARGLLPASALRTEAEFTEAVLSLARLNGWLAVWHRPARTATGWRTAVSGDVGSQDVCLARGGVVILAELKAERGRLGPGQAEWRAAAGDHGRLWKPSDWPRIVEQLR